MPLLTLSASILTRPIAVYLAVFLIFAQALWIYLAHRRSRNREVLFRIITENAADMIALVDTKGRRLYNSPAYQRILGYSPAELAQTSVFEQIHPDDRFKVLEAAREARTTGVGKTLQYRLRHKNGDWRILESTASTIRNDKGEVEKLVIINRDITQRVEAEEKLAHNALHDALTGLHNRRLFLDRLQRAFAQSRRDPDYHYAVLLADVDRFKSINRDMGSELGDRVLLEIGTRLQACLRETDTLSRVPEKASVEVVLSRLGGDEFAILLEGCSDPSNVLRIAERLQAAVAAPLVVDQGVLNLRISIGIAFQSGRLENSEDALRDAEAALRRAQAMGGGRSELFDPAMHKRAVSRLKLEAELRNALNRNQFRILYQPIFQVEPRQVLGFEALLRWQHPEQGLISPQEFLAAAEDTGLMAMIDQWVIREACRHLPQWISSRSANMPLRISVNLSARHFAGPQLIDGIKSCLRDGAIPPNTLQLEVSEQVAATNPELTANLFAQLKRQEVVTAIDDFSASHCSLARLFQISPQVVKIDHKLIARMLADRTSHDVVEAIFLLARKVNSEIIAEGIERPAQLQALRTLGCTLAQGYFFSSPVTADVAQQFLQKSQTLNKTHPTNVLSS